MAKSCIVSVLVTPATDQPGAWVAHCLNLDVVSQGDSIEHALEMVREAVVMAVNDDLEAGLDPLERAPAPDEYWGVFDHVHRMGCPVDQVRDRSRITALVTKLKITRPDHPALDGHGETEELPPAWQIAALESLRNSPTPGLRH